MIPSKENKQIQTSEDQASQKDSLVSSQTPPSKKATDQTGPVSDKNVSEAGLDCRDKNTHAENPSTGGHPSDKHDQLEGDQDKSRARLTTNLADVDKAVTVEDSSIEAESSDSNVETSDADTDKAKTDKEESAFVEMEANSSEVEDIDSDDTQESFTLLTVIKHYGLFLLLALLLLGGLVWWFNHQGASKAGTGRDFSIARSLTDKQGPNISDFAQDRQWEFDPDAKILVHALKENHVSVGVSNRDGEPLFAAAEKEVAPENDPHGNLPEPEILPWFYYSPNVERVSPTSRANEYALTRKEVTNDFSWNRKEGETYLLHEDTPYTGWYSLTNEGWRFYDEGRPTDHAYNLVESQKMMEHAERIHHLIPGFTTRKIYERPVNEYAFHIGIRPYSYSILFKNPQAMILTSPPGTKGSALLSTTENFVDLPMEVVEEARTPSGSWLHVYIGYDELGWIKKDVTKTDYVTTYYSERNLLDNIEYTLSEEFANIQARVGGSFVNNDTMSQISVNNQQFFPASTQKIYVLGELYHQYATGNLTPDTYVTMTDDDKVPGAGVIQGQASGTMYSMNELVDLVTNYSDNTAANLLIDMVGGGETITPHLHKIGLYDTYVSGKYYYAGSWFRTTPENAARYFALLANNRLNGAPYDEQLISKFMMNTHTFLRQQLWSVPSWNKTGLGGTEQNDVATFNTEMGSYSLAVYTAEPAFYKRVGEQLGQVGFRVYQVYMDIRSQLYQTVEDPAELTGDPDYDLSDNS